MAAVFLDRVWLTSPSDLSVSVATLADFDDSETTESDGKVMAYANGRRRLITTAATTRTISRTLQALTDDDLALLRSWQGTVVLYRDELGRKCFGALLAVPETPREAGSHDVKMTLTEIDFSEAV